jgi:hypothetical protein
MSILLAFQGAPPAEPDLIDLFVECLDLFEAPDDDPGFFIAANIFDDVPIFQLADEPADEHADDLASFISDFVHEAAQEDLIFQTLDEPTDEFGEELASFVQDLIFDVQAADDLIQQPDDAVAEEIELELLSSIDGLIENDAPIDANYAPEGVEYASDGLDDAPESLADALLIEDDASVETASGDDAWTDDEEAPDCFLSADIFLPSEGEPILVVECLQDDDADPEPLESFASAETPEDPFVPDPGEVIDTFDSKVFVPAPDDPNRDSLFISSHAEFDDEPPPPSSGDHWTVSGPDVGRGGLSAWYEYDSPSATLGTQRRTV